MGRLNSDVTEGLKVWIPSSTLQIKITEADIAKVSGSTPGALALNLFSTMFSTKQLSYGNCTDTNNRWHLLDQKVLQGIRCMCVQMYTFNITFIVPFTVSIQDRFQIPIKDEENNWKEIVGKLNSKCRNLRAKFSLTGKNKEAATDLDTENIDTPII